MPNGRRWYPDEVRIRCLSGATLKTKTTEKGMKKKIYKVQFTSPNREDKHFFAFTEDKAEALELATKAYEDFCFKQRITFQLGTAEVEELRTKVKGKTSAFDLPIINSPLASEDFAACCMYWDSLPYNLPNEEFPIAFQSVPDGGFTKREQIAKEVLVAMLGCKPYMGNNLVKMFVDSAIYAADELLAELERTDVKKQFND